MLGTVTVLRRYPVKSMLGEDLDASDVSHHADADVDEVLSALLNEPVTLTATPPPGASLDRAVPEAVLRDGIKAQVPAEIIEIGAGAPPGTFVDFAPLHLLTTATLDRIAELSPYRRAHLERYRPNVVIRTEAGASPRTTGSAGTSSSAMTWSCA